MPLLPNKLFPYIIPLGAALCLTPWVGSATALLLGAVIALTLGNPYTQYTRTWTHRLLPLSIIGLGAGMNLETVAKAGISGIGYTALSIMLTLGAGLLLGKMLRTEKESSLLISVGTAICGGSAIAAVAPVIGARPSSMSVALGVVFLLNAAALVLFPFLGHMMGLSQEQFGLWSALAIHDTSSVVGAGLNYGERALEIGTTVKLARALWIIPLVLVIQLYWNRNTEKTEGDGKAPPKKYPWFILGFLAMAALVTWVPALGDAGHLVASIARQFLVVTLFLIGAGLTRETLKTVGLKPLLQGVLLWVLVAGLSAALIAQGVISL